MYLLDVKKGKFLDTIYIYLSFFKILKYKQWKTFALASSRSVIKDRSLSAAWASRTLTSDSKSDFRFKSASSLRKSSIVYFDPGGSVPKDTSDRDFIS